MSSLPRGRGNPTRAYTVEGRTLAEDAERPSAGLQTVNPGYFATLEVPVLQGRGIETTDREGSQPVVVVSQAFVRREFPGEDPVGRTVVVGEEPTPRVIVGVVADVIQERIQLAGDRSEAMYIPLAQNPLRAVNFALRVRGDPTSVAGDVRQAVWSVNPDQPVAQLRTLDDFVAESLAGPRTLSLFLGAMGVIALLLAAMGIYGVMAHGVAQRQREIGIRMALGAGRGSVVGMITRGGLVLAGAGMLLGLPLSYLMYRGVVSALNLFETEVGMSYAAGVTLALGAVAVLATYVPARRASGVHPGAALRD
jgi:predicted permease